jgi:hypothetical protein
MNVFGFNDDLGPLQDDRIIIQNPAENAKYSLVERPKYLLQFDYKDSENDFLFKMSKLEAKKTTNILFMLLVLNKLIIIGDILEHGSIEFSIQFMSVFPIFILELLLLYKLNNPTREGVNFWTGVLGIYGVIVLVVLMSLEMKYLNNWSRAGFNELLFETTMSLLFFMRNIFLRQFILIYLAYFSVTIAFCSIWVDEVFQYQTL